MRIAAVTMSYNEFHLLPVWIKYYSQQIGAENCYVIDHGSDDGSTKNLDVNVVRIPRSPKDNVKRTRFISGFCSDLLEWYDVVIHADVDEIVVPDPLIFTGIKDYAESMTSPCITSVGFDVLQVPELEDQIDFSWPITLQRSYVRFSSSMCKPVIVKGPITWAPGFHSSNYNPVFGNLYLFHLHYVDTKNSLRRLQFTRSMPWATEGAGRHQRMPDEEFSAMVSRWTNLPRNDLVNFNVGEEPISGYIRQAYDKDKVTSEYKLDLHVFGDELWKIPERFRGTF